MEINIVKSQQKVPPLTYSSEVEPHSNQKQIFCISFAGYGENHLQ